MIWNGKHEAVDATDFSRGVKAIRPKRCDECGTNWADHPSRLCPGCNAYREHTGAI